MAVIGNIWIEEKDYSTYPKNKWCDYDYLAVYIRAKGYEPQTSMENLIDIIFAHYDCELEETGGEFSIEGCQKYVEACGISEFDYEC